MAKKRLKVLTTLEQSHVKTIDAFKSGWDDSPKVNWDKSTAWKVTSEGERGFIILRYLRLKDKSTVKERLDRDLYEFQKQNRHKCEEVCRILNYRLESKKAAKEAWLIRSAFIKVQGSELSQKFEAYMFARSSNRKHAKQCRRLVEMYFLNYFYNVRQPALYDYLEWVAPKVQAEFIEYLLSVRVEASRNRKVKAALSADRITKIRQYSNYFMRFLHQESDGNIPLLQFTFPSITQARLTDHERKRKKHLPDQTSASQYIDEATFKRIYKAAPEELKSSIWLCYKYGLRRSEVLALELESLKKSHLRVESQLVGLEIERNADKTRAAIVEKRTGPLKNRDDEGRKVPHWFAKPDEVYEHLQKLYVVNPSGLTEMWIELMKKMGLSFTFHNLRNAFCSNALRDMNKLGISAVDVQLAMGHADLRTTMLYLRDFRGLEDEDAVWTPGAG
jgi:integrase